MDDRIEYHANRMEKSSFSFGYVKAYLSLSDKPNKEYKKEYSSYFKSKDKKDVNKAKGFFAYFRDLQK